MLVNYHTHSTFCDGENTLEEMVRAAIDRGFSALGFSGHNDAPYCTYVMRETEKYIAEVKRLKEVYKDKIQIYLGIEEDIYTLEKRENFDYIIGSKHYAYKDNQYYSMDSSEEHLQKCLALWGNDTLAFAENYYSEFCNYIKNRKPDIVGHFDLLTKYDEQERVYFLDNKDYHKLAQQYLEEAIQSGCIFEVNTGAMGKGYRTTPYPHENLLHVLKKHGAKVMLSSDSHSIHTLDYGFDEVKARLKEVGFQYTYIIYNGEFCKDYL